MIAQKMRVEQLRQVIQEIQASFQDVHDKAVFMKRAVKTQGAKVIKRSVVPIFLSGYFTTITVGVASYLYSDSPFSLRTVLVLPAVVFGVHTFFVMIVLQIAEDRQHSQWDLIERTNLNYNPENLLPF